ncbi:hypothetical protein LT336_00536 [Spiroplasma sp. JKS002671]|uniref:hypothetical protein n=1 Tax=Spiroplasma attinicola TaxID=2904537 RepID=UPI002022AADB|nr:hypothetical protein [Spiroplasma sp. JKS002671]MCL8210792.1 hypothetical protein [Spiroplasma sp. JKS002671]
MRYCEYQVLNIDKVSFSELDINDEFFNSLREDYPKFNTWFNMKQRKNEIAYVYKNINNKIQGFLYLKIESKDEKYDFEPLFTAKTRLKIGTFKVTETGYKMGERFLKIIFDNALLNKVDEIYVTLFENNKEKLKLKELLEIYGFNYWGQKENQEKVYVKKMIFDENIDIVKNYPLVNFDKSSYFLLPIKPEYHTNLLPDCILKTEAPENFKQNLPWQNAIKKAYIGDNLYENIKKGDIIIFYRTSDSSTSPARFRSVLTGIGIVLEKKSLDKHNHPNLNSLLSRSVLTIEQLKNYKNPNYLEFLFLRNFNKRITLGDLRDKLNLFNGPKLWAPRGLYKITKEEFIFILNKSN